MVRSLWTAASGMNAQQANIDAIANNISNVNTTAFKRQRVEFEDLIYQSTSSESLNRSGAEEAVDSVGIQTGSGVRIASTNRVMAQGAFLSTGVPTDIAIEGEGFFRVCRRDGTFAYTRDGSFRVDSEGHLVTSGGLCVSPGIKLPECFRAGTLSVSGDGKVSVKADGSDESLDAGRLILYRFPDATALESIGGNLYAETAASGAAVAGTPGRDGTGVLKQGMLEASNVSIVNEMVRMISSQRAYEAVAKVIQTSDSMLKTAVKLKR